MRYLIEGIIAVVWGIAVVVNVTMKTVAFLNSGGEFGSYHIGFIGGGVLGLALAIWGVFRIIKWKNKKNLDSEE